MALTVRLLVLIVALLRLSFSMVPSSEISLGSGRFSLADVLAQAAASRNGYFFNVSTNLTITGSHHTILEIEANSVSLNLANGSILHMANLTLKGATPTALPFVVALDAARIRGNYLPQLDTTNLVRFPWLEVSESSSLLLTGVELVVECAQLLNLQQYMCAGGWLESVESNQTHVILHKWLSHNITVVDVAMTCANASMATCHIQTIQDEDSLRLNLNLNSQVPLLVNIVAGSLTLADRGLWAHQLGPVAVLGNVIIQGSKHAPALVDFHYRSNLFVFTKPNTTLTMSNITLRGHPLGPASLLNMIWMPTLDWWCLVVPSILPGPYIMAYNVTVNLFEDLAMAVFTAWGDFYSTDLTHRASAAWLASLITEDTNYGKLTERQDMSVFHVNGSLGPRSLYRGSRAVPIKGFVSGIKGASSNYVVPLSQVWPAVNASHFLKQLSLGSSNPDFNHNAFGIVLLGNVSLLDPDVDMVLPHEGLWLYRSVFINSWRYAPTTIDFGYKDNVLRLATGVKVKLMNLVLMNLPSRKPLVDGGVFQLTMMWGLGLWPVSYTRQATSSLQLENCTVVVGEIEANLLWYINMRSNLCANAPCIQSNGSVATIIGGNLAYLQTPIMEGMGYEASNLSIVTTPPFPMPVRLDATMLNHSSISYASFQEAYGINASDFMSTSSENHNNGLEGWQLALVCVVIVLFLVLLGGTSGLVYRFLYSCGHTSTSVLLESPGTKSSDISQTALMRMSTVNDCTARCPLPPFSDIATLEIDAAVVAMQSVGDAELIVGESLGVGPIGNVRKGSWRGMDVALKTIRVYNENVRHIACTEAGMLMTISHPNIVACYKYIIQDARSGRSQSRRRIDSGHCWSVCLVLEYCSGGGLDDMVDNRGLMVTDDVDKHAFKLVLALALDIARGLHHIHNINIIHGDLNTSNVLLQTTAMEGFMQAKVGNFGLSQVLAESRTHMSGVMQGTMFYSPPELMVDGRLSRAADVYAFGVILWEMYHGTPPWRRRKCTGVVHSLELLDWAAHCPAAYASLARQCMNANPGSRPTIADCVTKLEKIHNAMFA